MAMLIFRNFKVQTLFALGSKQHLFENVFHRSLKSSDSCQSCLPARTLSMLGSTPRGTCVSRATLHQGRLSRTVTPHVTATGTVMAGDLARSFERQRRYLSKLNDGPMTESEIKSGVDRIGEMFQEARELLEDARDVKDTVYFSEDMEEAAEAVNAALEKYADLLKRLSDEQRQNVVRTIGLKMEELRAQKNALEEEIKHE